SSGCASLPARPSARGGSGGASSPAGRRRGRAASSSTAGPDRRCAWPSRSTPLATRVRWPSSSRARARARAPTARTPPSAPSSRAATREGRLLLLAAEHDGDVARAGPGGERLRARLGHVGGVVAGLEGVAVDRVDALPRPPEPALGVVEIHLG